MAVDCPDAIRHHEVPVPELAARDRIALVLVAVLAANDLRASTFLGYCALPCGALDVHATIAALASHNRPSNTHDDLGHRCVASPPAY